MCFPETFATFSPSPAEGGGWKCLQRRNLINQWLNKEIEKVRKARKFIRRWIEGGGHEAINFNIYFYRGGFKIWLELENWPSLLIRSFHGCRRLVWRRCYLIKTNQCSGTVIVGVESLKFDRKRQRQADGFIFKVYLPKKTVCYLDIYSPATAEAFG